MANNDTTGFIFWLFFLTEKRKKPICPSTRGAEGGEQEEGGWRNNWATFWVVLFSFSANFFQAQACCWEIGNLHDLTFLCARWALTCEVLVLVRGVVLSKRETHSFPITLNLLQNISVIGNICNNLVQLFDNVWSQEILLTMGVLVLIAL